MASVAAPAAASKKTSNPPEKSTDPSQTAQSDATSSKKEDTPPAPKAPQNYPGKGLLEIEVAEDKMSCAVKDFKEKWHDDYTLDQEWLEYEMIRLRIKDRDTELLKRVRENLTRKKNINALALAKGDPGTPPLEPKLTVVEQKKESKPEGDPPDQEVDFRKSRIQTVTKGTKIAQFVFGSEGINGHDIFGDEVNHPPPELPQVEILDGAQAGHHYDYYATMDGLSKVDIESRTIEVSKTYLVEGDVSLVTGNISFDGSVHVTGGLRDKAIIECSKDITIEGGVANGFIRCKGKVEVGLGIVKSNVVCKEDVSAGFIEHSTLFVGGALRSKKGLVNSQVVAEMIEVTEEAALIGGGSIFCQSKILTTNLGFPSNHPTKVVMGVDWNVARSLSINENREKNYKKELEETEKSLALFMKKSAAQTTKNQEEAKKGFQLKIKKLKKIIKKLGVRLRSLKSSSSECNDNALIKVTHELKANVDITMGTKKVSTLS